MFLSRNMLIVTPQEERSNKFHWKRLLRIIIHFASARCHPDVGVAVLGSASQVKLTSIQPELRQSKMWTGHNTSQLVRIIRDCQWWSLPWLFTVNSHQAEPGNRQHMFPTMLEAFPSLRLTAENSYQYKIQLMSAACAGDAWGFCQ